MQAAKSVIGDTSDWGHVGSVTGWDNRSAAEPDRIVSLFGTLEPDGFDQDVEGVTEQEWLATLDLVRQMSTRVRHSDESSREVARNAQTYMQHANEKVEEARRRAESAEATARAAEKRAKEAEARVSQAEERVQAAERRVQAFQAQAQNAETRAKEAQTWAKRLHLAIKQEFGPPEMGVEA